MNYYPKIKNFNIPTYLQFNSGLRDFELHVSEIYEKLIFDLIHLSDIFSRIKVTDLPQNTFLYIIKV